MDALEPWWWRLKDADGGVVTVTSEYAERRFATQSDAETWIGEFWRELAEQGVAAVVLVDVDREVYGPMSLSA